MIEQKICGEKKGKSIGSVKTVGGWWFRNGKEKTAERTTGPKVHHTK